MIELYLAYDGYDMYIDTYHEYEQALSVAMMYGGFVLSQTQVWQLEDENEDDDDWEDDEGYFKRKQQPKRKTNKLGYIL
ncbi:hypothetical protein NNG48_07310 [Enterococcus faecium]|nr:hypothetical protein [Enterococcus faecium]